MTARPHGTRRPFTVALCTSCSTDFTLAALEGLRATVRCCPQGMLVTTLCILRPDCRTACCHSPGVMVMFEPCSLDRLPTARPRVIGPINNASELRAVRRWLESGKWDFPIEIVNADTDY